MRTDILNEQRIRMFNIVRDIPYYISTGKEQDYSCATKPFLLDILMKSLGLKVQHILCTFKWEYLSLPEKLASIPHDDVETHEYLKVYIPEIKEWINLDPTWDSNIQHKSFKISYWNGVSSTPIAVPIEHEWSPQESIKLIEEEDNISEDERNNYIKRNGEFFRAFNTWLHELRRLR